jgi:hypothetical protein
MNQRITYLQLQELTAEQQDRLRSEWQPLEGEYIAMGDHEEMVYYLAGVEKRKSLPLLTIGQMLGYLKRELPGFTLEYRQDRWVIQAREHEASSEELYLALWESFKRVF